MTEKELYKYYYDQYTRDIDNLLNNKVKSRLYLGTTSKEADQLAEASLPTDEASRNIIKKAAEDALRSAGYNYNGTGTGKSPLTYDKYTHPRRWTPIQDNKLGNSIALATLEKLNKANFQPRASIANPNALQNDPHQLATNIISAMQAGQPIDQFIAMIPESPAEYYKAAFLYTLASSYPAKNPEVSKEMQQVAQRNKLNSDKYDIQQKKRMSWEDVGTMTGVNNGGQK